LFCSYVQRCQDPIQAAFQAGPDSLQAFGNLVNGAKQDNPELVQHLTMGPQTDPTSFFRAVGQLLLQQPALRKQLSHMGAVAMPAAHVPVESSLSKLNVATTWVELSPHEGQPPAFRLMWDLGNAKYSRFIWEVLPSSKSLCEEYAADLVESALGLCWISTFYSSGLASSSDEASKFHGRLAQVLVAHQPVAAAEVLKGISAPPPPYGPGLSGRPLPEDSKPKQKKKPKEDKPSKAKVKDSKSQRTASKKPAGSEARSVSAQSKGTKRSRCPSSAKKAKKAKGGKAKKRSRSRNNRQPRRSRKSSTSSSSRSSSTSSRRRPHCPRTPSQARRPSPPASRRPDQQEALLKATAVAQLEALATTMRAYHALTSMPMDLTSLTETPGLASHAAAAVSRLEQRPQTGQMGSGGPAAAPQGAKPPPTEIFTEAPGGPQWMQFFNLTKAEASVKSGTLHQVAPRALDQRVLDTVLKCVRFGRPFGIGMLHDYYLPVGRISAILSSLLHRYEGDTRGFTPEETFGMLKYSWEHASRSSPFELLYLVMEPNLLDTAGPPREFVYVRAKQSLIAQPTLAADGGPATIGGGGRGRKDKEGKDGKDYTWSQAPAWNSQGGSWSGGSNW
jgi:hypothetical protein